MTLAVAMEHQVKSEAYCETLTEVHEDYAKQVFR